MSMTKLARKYISAARGMVDALAKGVKASSEFNTAVGRMGPLLTGAAAKNLRRHQEEEMILSRLGPFWGDIDTRAIKSAAVERAEKGYAGYLECLSWEVDDVYDRRSRGE